MNNLVGRHLVSARWILLGVACLLTVWAWQPAGQLQFDRSIENMFSPHDPLLAAYRTFRQLFGEHDLVMAVYVDPDLLAADGRGIDRLVEVNRQLRAIPGIRDVLSLWEVDQALQYGRVLRQLVRSEAAPYLIVQPDNPLAASFRDMFEGYTHDAEGHIAGLVCLLEREGGAGVSRRETIDRMRRVIELQPRGMLAGEPVMVIDGFRYVEQDGERLGRVTTWLLALVIIACFRSLRWVLIPILVVQLSLLLTRATLVWLELRLSMVSSMLTALVTVVGVATVVHVIVRFRQARGEGLPQRAAMIRTIGLLGVPIFWACATDAVGFLALTFARVGPVRDFGVMTAIGCLWVFCSVAILVPGLALWGSWDADPRRAWGDARLGSGLDRLARSARRHAGSVSIGLLAVCAIALTGLFRLEVETDFTRNFRRGSPVVVSYAFVERHLGGAGVWDVLLPAPPTLDPDYLQRVRAFQERLRGITIRNARGQEVPGLTKVLSLVDAIDATESHPVLRRIPAELRVRGMSAAMPQFLAALRAPAPDPEEGTVLRIMLRAREQQDAAAKMEVIHEVMRIAQEHFPATAGRPSAQVTGSYVLLTHLIISLLRDQWICFAIAIGGVAVMMTLAFRSPLLASIALVPNILPIVVVLGAMGWLGIRVNMGVAMIAAVSMGLSVDSSIHYIASFRRARAAGASVAQSLAEVQQAVGRAVVYSTLALMVGFLALCSSEFIPTIYFGVLVSLAMLGGLAGNLIILPLLLSVSAGRVTAAGRTGPRWRRFWPRRR
jgi:uncharacterized protein